MYVWGTMKYYMCMNSYCRCMYVVVSCQSIDCTSMYEVLEVVRQSMGTRIYILVTGLITFHTKTLKPKEKKSSCAIVSHFHMSYIWAWLIWTNVRKIEASLNTRHCLHEWTKVCPLFPRLLINPWTEFWHPLRLLMSSRLRQLCPIPRDGLTNWQCQYPSMYQQHTHSLSLVFSYKLDFELLTAIQMLWGKY